MAATPQLGAAPLKPGNMPPTVYSRIAQANINREAILKN